MLWICEACTCRYSVGAPSCPQCGSTEYVEEGSEDMPKITVHGGPSFEGEPADPPSEAAPVLEPESDTPSDVGASESQPGGTTVNYGDLTVQQLREELSRRGLDHNGLKAELVERLQASDSGENGDVGA